MDLRLVEILLPSSQEEEVRALLAEVESLEVWHEPAFEKQRIVRMVVEAEQVELVIDRLEQRFGHLEGFRALILRIEATVPRPHAKEPAPAPDAKPAKPKHAMRVSREELLAALAPGLKVSRRFLGMVVLSAIVAAAGLLTDNVAVIIGAMVIAPLLTPNMALALATTLGDLRMSHRAARTNAIGVGLAFGFALLLGLVLGDAPATREILARTHFTATDAVVALAAGSAGVLAFTAGVPAGLVGVMVAVALMPPLVAGGLLLGSGEWVRGGNALMLLALNVIGVNLAAVVTFLLQGVRPRTWWEADKARHATRRAVVIWAVLLAILVALSILLTS
jgi:uncharacterized hydrophobic protein (TIGR00341 family)